jgi:hypothetical protein
MPLPDKVSSSQLRTNINNHHLEKTNQLAAIKNANSIPIADISGMLNNWAVNSLESVKNTIIDLSNIGIDCYSIETPVIYNPGVFPDNVVRNSQITFKNYIINNLIDVKEVFRQVFETDIEIVYTPDLSQTISEEPSNPEDVIINILFKW